MGTTAIILAGGRGARLGGQDKGWIQYADKPLIEHLIERLRDQVDEIVISCNRNLDRYRKLGYPIVADTEQNFGGPLAGIAAAASHCHESFVLLSPCDTPLLPLNLAQRLGDALEDSPYDAAIPTDGHHQQYLCSLLRRRVISSAAHSLKTNKPAVKAWLATLQTVSVDFSDQAIGFSNINRPADLPTTPR